MTQSTDFNNLKSVFRHTKNTTAVVDLLIKYNIAKFKYNIHNPIVRKTYKEQGGIGYFSNYRNMFQNEVKYLKIVNGIPHFPKLIFVDTESCSIYMEYSGTTIFNDIIPVDWKKQLNVIIATLKTSVLVIMIFTFII